MSEVVICFGSRGYRASDIFKLATVESFAWKTIEVLCSQLDTSLSHFNEPVELLTTTRRVRTSMQAESGGRKRRRHQRQYLRVDFDEAVTLLTIPLELRQLIFEFVFGECREEASLQSIVEFKRHTRNDYALGSSKLKGTADIIVHLPQDALQIFTCQKIFKEILPVLAKSIKSFKPGELSLSRLLFLSKGNTPATSLVYSILRTLFTGAQSMSVAGDYLTNTCDPPNLVMGLELYMNRVKVIDLYDTGRYLWSQDSWGFMRIAQQEDRNWRADHPVIINEYEMLLCSTTISYPPDLKPIFEDYLKTNATNLAARRLLKLFRHAGHRRKVNVWIQLAFNISMREIDWSGTAMRKTKGADMNIKVGILEIQDTTMQQIDTDGQDRLEDSSSTDSYSHETLKHLSFDVRGHDAQW